MIDMSCHHEQECNYSWICNELRITELLEKLPSKKDDFDLQYVCFMLKKCLHLLDDKK